MLNIENIIAGIKTWVEIESPTYDVAGNKAMLDLVTQEFAGLPVKFTRFPPAGKAAGMLLVEFNPSDKKGILVLSHLDTVHPLGVLKDRLPFKQDDDKLYGPGLYDMKGGAYIALEAFKMMLNEGKKPYLPITFLYTTDEEVGSLTSRAKIEELAKNAAYCLVTEPARDGGRIVTARKGVGRFIMSVKGVPAHSGSRHQDGRSAIKELAYQILQIEAMTDYARGITTTVGIVSGGTAANVTPEYAQCDIDLRVPNEALASEMTAKILGLKPHFEGVSVSVKGAINRPPYPKDEKGAALLSFAQNIAKLHGYELEDCPMTGGGSDGNFTAALGVPTLDGLGIDGAGAHTLHEHGLVSSIPRQLLVMKGLMEGLK